MPSAARNRRCIVTIAGALALLFAACAGSGTLPGRDKPQPLSAVADSLFASGNFDEAVATCRKIIAASPDSEEIKHAIFAIAYSNVFYKNSGGDWNAALEKFESFARSYPNDRHAGEALSWVRILTIIKSVDNELRQATSRAERLRHDKNTAQENRRFYLDSIGALLRSSSDSRDSLQKKNRDLENVIIDLEKKCQQAGK
jgi:outer membrane protein assembly factor BamD (BamD/ComL family)